MSSEDGIQNGGVTPIMRLRSAERSTSFAERITPVSTSCDCSCDLAIPGKARAMSMQTKAASWCRWYLPAHMLIPWFLEPIIAGLVGHHRDNHKIRLGSRKYEGLLIPRWRGPLPTFACAQSGRFWSRCRG